MCGQARPDHLECLRAAALEVQCDQARPIDVAFTAPWLARIKASQSLFLPHGPLTTAAFSHLRWRCKSISLYLPVSVVKKVRRWNLRSTAKKL